MIDGGLFPELIAANASQGVPTVMLNGKVFANGKVDTAKILQQLLPAYPPSVASAQVMLRVPDQSGTRSTASR